MIRLLKNKITVFILLFFLLIPVVRVDATMGNINSFIYSGDYFYGDYSGVNNLLGKTFVDTVQPFGNQSISLD